MRDAAIRHATAGATQWVEVRERIDEIVIRKKAPAIAKQLFFGRMSDPDLLGSGVPTEWLTEIRTADEDSFLRRWRRQSRCLDRLQAGDEVSRHEKVSPWMRHLLNAHRWHLHTCVGHLCPQSREQS
ncbi:hypothetical protein [Variovorax sp. V116]|uniref:hypothetical protein n=1 Tax=Variovorax sp. V116 TaxID=3065953 RepID=UPI0034E84084